MARKGGSFNFAKRAKELKKQKKRQAKLERKRNRAAAGAESTGDDVVEMIEAPLGFEEDGPTETATETKTED